MMKTTPRSVALTTAALASLAGPVVAQQQITTGGPTFETALKSEGRLGTDYAETFANVTAKRLEARLKKAGRQDTASCAVTIATSLSNLCESASTLIGNVTIGRFSPVIGGITVIVKSDGSKP